MIFRKKPNDRRLFSLLDDESIGRISDTDADATFDDSLSGRSSAELSTGSFVGNFAARRVKRFGMAVLVVTFGTFLFRIGSWQVVHSQQY